MLFPRFPSTFTLQTKHTRINTFERQICNLAGYYGEGSVDVFHARALFVVVLFPMASQSALGHRHHIASYSALIKIYLKVSSKSPRRRRGSTSNSVILAQKKLFLRFLELLLIWVSQRTSTLTLRPGTTPVWSAVTYCHCLGDEGLTHLTSPILSAYSPTLSSFQLFLNMSSPMVKRTKLFLTAYVHFAPIKSSINVCNTHANFFASV